MKTFNLTFFLSFLLSNWALADLIPGLPAEKLMIANIEEPLTIQRLPSGKVHVANVPAVLNMRTPLTHKTGGKSMVLTICELVSRDLYSDSELSIPLNVMPVTSETIAAATGLESSAISNSIIFQSLIDANVELKEGGFSSRSKFLEHQGSAADLAEWVEVNAWWVNDNRRPKVHTLNLYKRSAFACDLLSGKASLEYETYVRVPLVKPPSEETLSFAQVSSIYSSLERAEFSTTAPEAVLGFELYKASKKLGADQILSKLETKYWINLVSALFDSTSRRLRVLDNPGLTDLTESIRRVNELSHIQKVNVRLKVYAE